MVLAFDDRIFLVLQLISVIQFITWWNKYWMPDELKKQRSDFLYWKVVISSYFWVLLCYQFTFVFNLVENEICIINLLVIWKEKIGSQYLVQHRNKDILMITVIT